MKKRKRISSNYHNKSIMLNIILVLFLFVGIGYSTLTSNLNVEGSLNVKKYDKTLYGIFEKEAKAGIYAREYTGAHQDSIDASNSTQKIYYWYGSDDTNGTDPLTYGVRPAMGMEAWQILMSFWKINIKKELQKKFFLYFFFTRTIINFAI